MIRIKPEPDLELTQAEYDSLRRQYDAEFRYWASVVAPPSFESWVRNRKQEAK